MGSGSKFHGGLTTQGRTGGAGTGSDTTGNGNGASHGQSPEMSPKGQELLARATTPEVKDLVKQLYRPGATIGDGGTADALRHEKATGQNTGSKGHETKARERVHQIEHILAKNPNHPDKALLQELYNNLIDALNGGNR